MLKLNVLQLVFLKSQSDQIGWHQFKPLFTDLEITEILFLIFLLYLML